MSADHDFGQLHDRATRGEPLSDAERAQLEDWYTQQDEEEHRGLFARRSQSETIATLEADVNAALAQLHAVTERIQILSAENDNLRRQIETLHRELAQKTAQPA